MRGGIHADDPALKAFRTQRTARAPCADAPETGKTDESALQCGRLKVAPDHADPAGGRGFRAGG
ncbi:hypothetical protein [Kitasatospora phosalacinea]|uniref:hypothetical protein n=1 Tax=Kitasatospora phosalacinea TaxID=2065 RepID=UPI000AC07AA9|nr:hypothetical protein [Kitasatospora phosalacinea]